jgi:hypothetical protein
MTNQNIINEKQKRGLFLSYKEIMKIFLCSTKSAYNISKKIAAANNRASNKITISEISLYYNISEKEILLRLAPPKKSDDNE